ncbi:MAG: hypothetical protein VX447_07810 [Pseudomonadota bacterium]|uniref:hypothetical protein n=1 Tax=Gallaecimonas pentaromativorans TaxID=584787 RepID=UPI00067F095F|nr:hypothetical protein [Gallaecimonas pentaromativorans]MED5524640.1 hypothetical protein [Pseudomonadota bacterium]
MQQMKVELLEKGDEVIGFSNDMLAVKKASGEVEIFKIDIDNDGLPRLSDKSMLITYGNKKSKKVTISNDDNSVEVGTF